jgi:hypothetical protein
MRSLRRGCCGAALAAASALPATAGEVASGALLDGGSLAALEGETLGGHRVGDLLAETQRLMIEKYGWRMRLAAPAPPPPPHPLLVSLTRQYHAQARLDAKKNLVGHVAGMPFPRLALDDPDAGIKLAYNILRTGWAGDAIDAQRLSFLVIDADHGLQREQGWHYKRFLTAGRLHEPHQMDDKVIKYEALVNLYPQDTRGIGVLTVHYQDGRLPDIYAYVKFSRRVRRLSSGTWADPIQSTDALQDETFGMNLHPTWYDAWNLKEKRFLLATLHGEIADLNPKENDPRKRFPAMDFATAPHWNFTEVYEPREVWVLEAIPAKSHLVSRKLYYIDTDPLMPLIYWGCSWDQKGDLWRVAYVGFKGGRKWDDGHVGLGTTIFGGVDIQRDHATIAYPAPDAWTRVNHPDFAVVDFTPEALPRMLK